MEAICLWNSEFCEWDAKECIEKGYAISEIELLKLIDRVFEWGYDSKEPDDEAMTTHAKIRLSEVRRAIIPASPTQPEAEKS